MSSPAVHYAHALEPENGGWRITVYFRPTVGVPFWFRCFVPTWAGASALLDFITSEG